MNKKIASSLLTCSLKTCKTVKKKYNSLTLKFLTVFLFSIAATFNFSAVAQTHNWTRTNPGGGGWFDSIGASASGIILAGSDLSGAYRSKDGGKSWDVCGFNRGLVGTHISGMGFHRKNGNIMFLGSNGISKTQNGGDSWKQVLESKGENRGYVTDIEMGTDKAWIGYAAWHGGNWNTLNAKVYKTTNTGNSWKPVSTNLPKLRIASIVVNPKNANVVYIRSGKTRAACSVADVFKSTNGGVTWTNITDNNNFEGFTEVSDFNLDPNNPNTMYISTVKADCDARFYIDGLDHKLFKSTDGGKNWVKLHDFGGRIFINPNNSNITLINTRATATWNDRSGTRLSTNGGRTFKKISNVSKWQPAFHGSLQSTYGNLGEDLSNPNNFFTYSTQFVTGSTDGGRNFKVLHGNKVGKNGWQSTGVDNIVNVDATISPANSNIIYLTMNDMGIWRSLDKGKSWENSNTDDEKYGWGNRKGGNFRAIVADPTRENVVWTTCGEGYILKSTNKGESTSWAEVNNGLPTTGGRRINGLSVDINSPRNNRTLYVVVNGSVYKSTNDGNRWSKVLDNKFCQFTAVDQKNGNIVYAGGTKGIWRSLNKGKDWKRLTLNDLPKDNEETSIRSNSYVGIFDIDTDPNNPNWVYVSVYGKGENKGLYRSKNKGDTWKKILSDKYMRKVAIMPKNSDIIYATSSSAQGSGGIKEGSNGIWFSKDGGTTWSKQIKGMAYPLANAIAISNENNPFVLVGSQGTGFQTAKVPARAKNPSKPSSAGNTNRIEVNGVFTIRNIGNQQNIIAPTWDDHNARMYNSTTIYPDHKWEFKHIGNGIHQIKNLGTNRFLQIGFGNCDRNANASTWINANSNHQKWYIEKRGKAHYFRPVHCSTMALDKSGGNNGNLKLWGFSATNNNQKFELISNTGAKNFELTKGPFIVSPNPTTGFVTIATNKTETFDITGVNAFSLKGDIVASFKNLETIDLTNLTNGMYLLEVNFKSIEGAIETKQVIKLIKE